MEESVDNLSNFEEFSNMTIKLNRLNKAFADFIDSILKHNNIYDLSSIQALILINIGEEKTNISRAVSKGYYLGTNTSYNIESLINKGYLKKQTCNEDMRCVYLTLTKKGIKALNVTNNAFLSQKKLLTKIGLGTTHIKKINRTIDALQNVLVGNYVI